jgi:hypothetical protein
MRWLAEYQNQYAIPWRYHGMANPWFRLWGDMVNDPKWRTISRKSGQRIGDVIAVALHMMTCASDADDRGRIQGWCDEDIATALDVDTEQVVAIREAMQGRILDGDYLTEWEKRQPKREREDNTNTERSQAFRAKQRHATPCNASDNQETPREEEIREEEIKIKPSSKARADATATRLPADWMPSHEDAKFCQAERSDLKVDETASRFRDYWIAQPGSKGRKTDWSATWRNWVRSERSPPARASPEKKSRHSGFDKIDYSEGVTDGRIV